MTILTHYLAMCAGAVLGYMTAALMFSAKERQ